MIWCKLSHYDILKRTNGCGLALESMEALNEDHS